VAIPIIPEGSVPKNKVIDVLRSGGVTVAGPDSDGVYTLSKGEYVEGQKLRDNVKRRMLQYLSRHFSIPIYTFYN
jgi:hypothetical protein